MTLSERAHKALAITLTVLAISACQEDSGRFPPPSGAGGDIAAGGTTSASGGGGAAPIPNDCECTYELAFDTGCGSCINDTNNAANGACYDVLTLCEAEPGCVDLFSTCPAKCKDAPAADRVDCVKACLLPFGDKAHDRAAAYLSCACPICAKACGKSQPIVCE